MTTRALLLAAGRPAPVALALVRLRVRRGAVTVAATERAALPDLGGAEVVRLGHRRFGLRAGIAVGRAAGRRWSEVVVVSANPSAAGAENVLLSALAAGAAEVVVSSPAGERTLGRGECLRRVARRAALDAAARLLHVPAWLASSALLRATVR